MKKIILAALYLSCTVAQAEDLCTGQVPEVIWDAYHVRGVPLANMAKGYAKGADDVQPGVWTHFDEFMMAQIAKVAIIDNLQTYVEVYVSTCKELPREKTND